MKLDKIEEELSLPTGATAHVSGSTISVKGPKGELSREIPKGIFVKPSAESVLVTVKDATKREKTTIFTFNAHLKSMLKGVSAGHEYTLKICSGHFPMNVSVKGNVFEIKNFIGESVPRRMPMQPGADVKIEGDKITVTGVDKQVVSQVAAGIEQITRRPGFDERIFQDGIYLTSKDGKKIS